MKLEYFKQLSRPFEARQIKMVAGVNYRFMSTMFGIDSESGEKIITLIKEKYL